KHNEQWLSAYGHNRKRLVSEGQAVKAGQQIAEMGRTGTDREKLHFEIRYNGKPVDPLLYLPKKEPATPTRRERIPGPAPACAGRPVRARSGGSQARAPDPLQRQAGRSAAVPAEEVTGNADASGADPRRRASTAWAAGPRGPRRGGTGRRG